MNDRRLALDARLVAAVARKLGCSVKLLRYDTHRPSGADIPVFSVPANRLQAAQRLGLAVEAERIA